MGGRRCDEPEEGYRWWRQEDLVDPDDPTRLRPLLPGGSGDADIPVGGFRIIDPITGKVVQVTI